jgi:3-oxoacyl-[acyl-carrier-protein] synthase-3
VSFSRIDGFRVAGVSTCVPPRRVDNLELGERYGAEDVRKVVSMAGVRHRHVSGEHITAVDLCTEAARRLLERLGWAPDSVTGLIMVTQSPDHFLPSSACVVHARLGLPVECAAFDMGLGCSGYPYGLYIAATMLKAGGQQRILMLHGETPSRFVHPDDHATTLLFGDAGSATALETDAGAEAACFGLFTDGSGADGLIIRGGAFRDRTPADPRDLCVRMDGAGIFNFTIKRVPPLVADTLAFAGLTVPEVDAFLFHQSNRFIMKHLMKKCGLPESKVPFTIEDTGNCGGPSVAVTLTRSLAGRDRHLRLMMLGYGVGLSWSSAVLTLSPEAPLLHGVLEESLPAGSLASPPMSESLSSSHPSP